MLGLYFRMTPGVNGALTETAHNVRETLRAAEENLTNYPVIFLSELEGGLWSNDEMSAWAKADICNAKRHVRFTPNSDRESRLLQTVMSALPPQRKHRRLLRAKSGDTKRLQQG